MDQLTICPIEILLGLRDVRVLVELRYGDGHGAECVILVGRVDAWSIPACIYQRGLDTPTLDCGLTDQVLRVDSRRNDSASSEARVIQRSLAER